jgi:hypothetical protein
MLYRTLEISAFLLLLEFVPAQDLLYFLEQAQDHYDVDPAADPELTHTPPTPGLLSSSPVPITFSHTSLPYRLYVCPDVRGCSRLS